MLGNRPNNLPSNDSVFSKDNSKAKTVKNQEDQTFEVEKKATLQPDVQAEYEAMFTDKKENEQPDAQASNNDFAKSQSMVNNLIQVKDEENPSLKSEEHEEVKNEFKRKQTKAPGTAAALIQPNMPNMA